MRTTKRDIEVEDALRAQVRQAPACDLAKLLAETDALNPEPAPEPRRRPHEARGSEASNACLGAP